MEDNNVISPEMAEHLECLVFNAHIKDLNLHKKNKKELQEEIIRLREEINSLIDGFKDAWEGLMPFFNQMNAMEKEIEKLQEENKKLRGIIRETIARRKELQ